MDAVSRILSMSRWLAVLLLLGIMGSACSKNEVPEGQPVPVAPTPAHLSGTSEQPAAGQLEFTAPEGWIQEQPSSAMRHSQYRLPGPDTGGDAELAIFTGIGGSVEQNVQRWINQFTVNGAPVGDAAKVSHRDISGFHVTFVDVSGTYNPGMMGGPMASGSQGSRDGYRMLAAVIETTGRPWFLKLTGPEKTVAKWQADFERFVASVR
ncbi:MAG: hypothetical protein Kow001_12440 [Acidobacteriota bacterium]